MDFLAHYKQKKGTKFHAQIRRNIHTIGPLEGG
jgi:hypothetical protein